MKESNAWLYTRKSRALGDPDDPHLLSHHIAALKRLAAADGITVPESRVRTEIGSGESISGRPVFADLLREWECLPPGIGGSIYVTEPSRLSRGSHQERGRIQDALIRAGLWVVSPERRYDPRNPADELTWSVIQAVDHNEISRYRQRVALRRDEMTRQGEVMNGSPPWGYRWIKSPGQIGGRKVPGYAEPDPDRFPLLVAACREVFTTSLARLAERYGVPVATLQAALHNPVICGYPARRHGPLPLPREQWIWPETAGTYPAACSREEWEAIQALLWHRWCRREKTTHVEDGWCRPLVRFVNTTGPVTLASSRGTPTYVCRRLDAPRLGIDREPVHAAAIAAIAPLFAEPGLLDWLLAELDQERAAAAPPEPAPERSARQLALERERLVTLKVELARPGLDSEDGRALLAAETECKRRIERLKAQLEPQPALAVLPDLTALRPLMDRLILEFEPAWEGLAGSAKQEVAVALLNEIPVTVGEGSRGYPRPREIGAPVYPEWIGRRWPEC